MGQFIPRYAQRAFDPSTLQAEVDLNTAKISYPYPQVSWADYERVSDVVDVYIDYGLVTDTIDEVISFGSVGEGIDIIPT